MIRLWAIVPAACVCSTIWAQGVLRPEPTGTVAGHITCADTQRPARLAAVRLVRVPKPTDPKPARNTGDAAPMSDEVQTALDGSYTLRDVKPGLYYLVAEKEGYLLPLGAFSQKDLATPDEATKQQIAAAIHTIAVGPDQTTREDMVLERGATVSGTVLYDDGSPASGLGVELLVKDKDGKWVPAELFRYRSQAWNMPTDDYGHYRITGLPAGEYATEVNLSLSDVETVTGPVPNNPSQTLTVNITRTRYSLPLYSGDVFRKPKAVAYTLGEGEVRAGSDLVFPLAKLHKVGGQVLAKDGHALNGGKIKLLYADDNTEMTETEVQYADQAFHLDFVPEGDFLLKVSDAKDLTKVQVENAAGYTPRFHEESKTVKTYGDAERALKVEGDAADVMVTVPESKPASKAGGGLD